VLGEVAFIAYHFHWSHGEIMRLPNLERKRWVAEISNINQRLNEAEAVEGGTWH
jgi:hypothetical protein